MEISRKTLADYKLVGGPQDQVFWKGANWTRPHRVVQRVADPKDHRCLLPNVNALTIHPCSIGRNDRPACAELRDIATSYSILLMEWISRKPLHSTEYTTRRPTKAHWALWTRAASGALQVVGFLFAGLARQTGSRGRLQERSEIEEGVTYSES